MIKLYQTMLKKSLDIICLLSRLTNSFKQQSKLALDYTMIY